MNIPMHGGNISEEARRLGVDESQLIDASASLVPFVLPKELKEVFTEVINTNQLKDYPDYSYKLLKQEIGAWHHLSPEMVLPGNGASELFTWAARDASEIGVSGLPSPGFADYSRAINCWNGQYKYLKLPLKWSEKKPQDFPIKSSLPVIWITNPHNPTGQLWSKESIERILSQGILVICDEAFLPIVPQGEEQSVISLIKKYDNLIIIRSFTKVLPIAGLRVGYAVSSRKRIEKWNKIRDPWPVNQIAAKGITMLMKEKKIFNNWLKKIHAWVYKEGSWIKKEINNFSNLIYHPSSANFILIESNQSLIHTREKLANMRILIRDCRSFENLNDKWLRISFKERSDNERIINALKYFIQ
tara:strand:+ start:48 stop:1124 length:1077 start_codon:yes stop_codon:yes gene_type:complete